MMRLFLAVELPTEAQKAANQVSDRLCIANAEVRWVATENIHITLRFLGDVAQGDVHSLCQEVESQLVGAESFEAALEEVGTFPRSGHARVIWVGVSQGARELKELALRVNKGLARIGFPPENRRFSPHATLGRVRKESVSACQVQQMALIATPFSVDGITLFESQLSRHGSRYTRVARFEFDANR